MSSELFDRLSKTEELYKKASGMAVEGVYLYGAGFVGRWALDYLEGIGAAVLGFIDSDTNKWNLTIMGKKIFSPTDPLVLSARVILISSRHAVPAIQKALAHLSATIMSIDAFVVQQQGKEKIQQIETIFSHDPRSLDTFWAVLISMLEGRTTALGRFADNRPFFDRFGFFNRDAEIFVDAGAYVGDSLERFVWSVNGVFRHIYAFEPGKAQFEAMQKRVNRLVSEWAIKPESISMVNKGISSKSGVVRVDDGVNLTQTKIENCSTGYEIDESVKVKTISLDEYFNGEKFTFLKVDVEGSESDLLSGAQKSIAEHHPRIALSVYHYPTDIFLLPQQCVQANSDYIFSLGHHSSRLMETVLYCRDKSD